MGPIGLLVRLPSCLGAIARSSGRGLVLLCGSVSLLLLVGAVGLLLVTLLLLRCMAIAWLVGAIGQLLLLRGRLGAIARGRPLLLLLMAAVVTAAASGGGCWRGAGAGGVARGGGRGSGALRGGRRGRLRAVARGGRAAVALVARSRNGSLGAGTPVDVLDGAAVGSLPQLALSLHLLLLLLLANNLLLSPLSCHGLLLGPAGLHLRLHLRLLGGSHLPLLHHHGLLPLLL
mmetsp:Transcript_16395/g.45683  ORF Transcript_16395/g.45683 Transcript_16395/m.45683 type:complete len:231 (+) Transcript_16395:1453-2145(+)